MPLFNFFFLPISLLEFLKAIEIVILSFIQRILIQTGVKTCANQITQNRPRKRSLFCVASSEFSYQNCNKHIYLLFFFSLHCLQLLLTIFFHQQLLSYYPFVQTEIYLLIIADNIYSRMNSWLL